MLTDQFRRVRRGTTKTSAGNGRKGAGHRDFAYAISTGLAAHLFGKRALRSILEWSVSVHDHRPTGARPVVAFRKGRTERSASPGSARRRR